MSETQIRNEISSLGEYSTQQGSLIVELQANVAYEIKHARNPIRMVYMPQAETQLTMVLGGQTDDRELVITYADAGSRERDFVIKKITADKPVILIF